MVSGYAAQSTAQDRPFVEERASLNAVIDLTESSPAGEMHTDGCNRSDAATINNATANSSWVSP